MIDEEFAEPFLELDERSFAHTLLQQAMNTRLAVHESGPWPLLFPLLVST
jgi:hypothetical protein